MLPYIIIILLIAVCFALRLIIQKRKADGNNLSSYSQPEELSDEELSKVSGGIQIVHRPSMPD